MKKKKKKKKKRNLKDRMKEHSRDIQQGKLTSQVY